MKILFVSHDANRAGAQLFLLSIMKYLKQCQFETMSRTMLRGEFVCLLFLDSHQQETDRFLATSQVQIPQTNFHFLLVVFSSPLKSKVDNIVTKSVVLRINLNIDGTPIASRSHTHPSHEQNSRLLTSSLSFGVPVPHVTQCM